MQMAFCFVVYNIRVKLALPSVDASIDLKYFLKNTKNCFAEGIDRIKKYDILEL